MHQSGELSKMLEEKGLLVAADADADSDSETASPS